MVEKWCAIACEYFGKEELNGKLGKNPDVQKKELSFTMKVTKFAQKQFIVETVKVKLIHNQDRIVTSSKQEHLGHDFPPPQH